MSIRRSLSNWLIIVLLSCAPAFAQESAGPRVTVATAGGRVRFTASGSSVQRVRLEVFDAAGETVLDTGFNPGNVRDWTLQNSRGKRLPDGDYVCVLAVRESAGRLTFRQAGVHVEGGQASLALDDAGVKTVPTEAATTSGADMPKDGTTPYVSGTGTTGKLVKWTNGPAGALGDSVVTESGGNIGIGVTPTSKLHVSGTANITGNLTLGANATSTTGTLSGNTVNAKTQYNLNGSRVLGVSGSSSYPMTNIFAGVNTGSGNTSSYFNSFFGWGAGHATTSGHGNSFFGKDAGIANTTGNNNSFFGVGAGAQNTSGGGNAFYGVNAGRHVTTASFNTFFGTNAGTQTTDGDQNAFFGAFAGDANTTGVGNSFVGRDAGRYTADGGYNVFVGRRAGYFNTTGSFNTFVGPEAGYNEGGQRNTYIGWMAGSSLGSELFNATAIGALADVEESNTMVLGTSSVTVKIPGKLMVSGSVSKGSGSFVIDHPLDPLNKYLYHSFVESPDMMNIYNGNVTTNARGLAVVHLPAYFQALNRDFRYQLTVLGQFAQAIVARKIEGNTFVVKTNRPRVEVSWQVTGVRQDTYANLHRIQVEQEKPLRERGTYLHPEAFK
jgi:hypothetical protein